jgi:hypothetical protein
MWFGFGQSSLTLVSRLKKANNLWYAVMKIAIERKFSLFSDDVKTYA